MRRRATADGAGAAAGAAAVLPLALPRTLAAAATAAAGAAAKTLAAPAEVKEARSSAMAAGVRSVITVDFMFAARGVGGGGGDSRGSPPRARASQLNNFAGAAHHCLRARG